MDPRLAAAALLAAALAACVPLDFFLFDSDEASLDDYDFTSEALDGIDPARITSTLAPTADGERIHVLFVERDASRLDPRLDPDAGIAVLFHHGNTGNMRNYWYRVGYFEQMGFHVLMYDYRGYGASEGETTERNVYEDAVAAYDWLAARDGVGEIVSVGYSLGGAPAIYLCSPESGREVAACFTEAAFASVDALVDRGAAFDLEGAWLLDAKFDNLSRIASVTVPFLLVHGTEDWRVDFENGERLFEAVRGNHPLNRFFPVEGATHRNVPIPSYPGRDEPTEYSYPDEMPPELLAELRIYQRRLADLLAEALPD